MKFNLSISILYLMPFRTSGGNAMLKTRGGMRKRRVVRRRRGVSGLAKSVARLRREVRANRELKHYDAPVIFTATGSTGAVAQIDQITQGDTETTREGLVINPKSMLFRGEVINADNFNNCRIILFRWFDNTAPIVTDILNTTGIAGLSPHNAPYSWAQKPKYQILYDKVLTVDNESYNNENFMFKYKFRPTSKITYSGSVSTSIMSGNIFCLYINDSTAIAHPQLNAFIRLTFTDS